MRVHNFKQWQSIAESTTSNLIIVRSSFSIKSEEFQVEDNEICYLVAPTFKEALEPYLTNLRMSLEDISAYDPFSLANLLPGYVYSRPEDIKTIGEDLRSLESSRGHYEYFSPENWEEIETEGELVKDIADLGKCLLRDMELKKTTPDLVIRFMGKDTQVARVMVDLAERDPGIMMRYWNTEYGNSVPAYSKTNLMQNLKLFSTFAIMAEERGVKIENNPLKSFRIVAKMFEHPRLHKIARPLLGGMLRSKDTLDSDIVTASLALIKGEDNVLPSHLSLSTEQTQDLFDLIKGELTPEEIKAHETLLKYRGKII
jgi:hypothetical protein